MSFAWDTSSGTDPPLLRIIESRLRSTFEAAQEEALYELEECIPTSVVDSFTRKKRTRKVCLGDLRVAAIRKLLESGFGVTRSTMQKEFHESFLAACSRHLYSEDADVNWSEVKARQGWQDTRAVVLCQTPRRFGKTVSRFFSPYLFIARVNLCLPHHLNSGRSGSLSQPTSCAFQTASSRYSVRVKELPAKCSN